MKNTFLFIMVALCSMGMWAANPEAVYLTGNATPGGWSTDAAANQMYKTGEGTFVWTGTLAEGELKFLAGNDWVPSYGPAGGADMVLGANALLVRNSYDESDKKFAVAAGDYQLLLNISDGNAPQVWVSQLNWESVHMFVVPEALWGSEWSHDYTLKVSLKRWNGDDEQPSNWYTYTFSKSDAVYDNKAVYFGDVWICFGGFAQMTFEAYEGETKQLTYTFWPPETSATEHWITKNQFENKVFYGWNITDYPLADFPFISSTAGNRIWFDNSNAQWEHVYVRIGRDELTGAGNYAATWSMTQLAGTNLWYVDSEDWSNALVWTITDTNTNNGDYSVYAFPEGANRLYFYNYSITEKVLYIADGNAAQGTDGIGVNYWANHNVPFFTRDGLTPGNYGTICLPKAATLFAGAEMYRLVDKTAGNGIVIEEVDAMEAGAPYIFRATDSKLLVTLTGDDEQAAKAVNGLVGYIGADNMELNPDGDNRYILHSNQIWKVDTKVLIPSNRAYIDMSGISTLAQAPSKKRYVISGTNTATGIKNGPMTNDELLTTKVIRDGQLIIIRNGVEYNVDGKIVK